MPEWSAGRPIVSRLNASKHSSGVDHVISGAPSRFRKCMRIAKSRKISRSGLASPGGSTARSERCTVRSAFVNVPSFSPQIAAGSTTSASITVSLMKASCTTTNSSSFARIDRMRCSSGSDTAGLVPEIQRKRIDPSSAYRMICIACVGGPQWGIVSGSTFHALAS